MISVYGMMWKGCDFSRKSEKSENEIRRWVPRLPTVTFSFLACSIVGINGNGQGLLSKKKEKKRKNNDYQ